VTFSIESVSNLVFHQSFNQIIYWCLIVRVLVLLLGEVGFNRFNGSRGSI
jgi:hypothetical protein